MRLDSPTTAGLLLLEAREPQMQAIMLAHIHLLGGEAKANIMLALLLTEVSDE